MKRWPIPLYGGEVTFLYSPAEWRRAEGKLLEPPGTDVGCAVGLTRHSDDGMTILVGVFNQDLSTLVHECGHAALFICDRAGIETPAHNAEAFCYLLDNLFENGKKGGKTWL